jgi:hypothetical protein
MSGWADITYSVRRVTGLMPSCAAQDTTSESSCELSYCFFFGGCSKLVFNRLLDKKTDVLQPIS